MADIDVTFYNSGYKKRVYAYLSSTYCDESTFKEKKYSDGKLHGTISIDQYGRPGEYVVEEIEVTDYAKNTKTYGKYGDELPVFVKNTWFIVNNAGAGADLIVSTNTSDIAKQIAAQKDDAAIIVDYSNKSTISKDVFDAIKGTNKTLILESEGVQWIFNGKGIKNDSKSIDLSVDVNYVKDNTKDNDNSAISNVVKNKPTVVLTFPSNGTLPGTAKVRIKADYSMKQYLGQSGIYIYYVDNDNGKMVSVAKDLSITADSYVEFDITHCSKYIMVKGPLDNLNMSAGSSSSGGSTKSNSSSGSSQSSVSSSSQKGSGSSSSSSSSSGFSKGDVKTAGKGASRADYKKISAAAVRYESSGVSSKTKKAVVPATVKIGGKTYKVTSVAPKAFDGKSNLTSLSIGKNVKKIGESAFSGCKKLKILTLYTKGLTKKSVKKSLTGSYVNKIKSPASKVEAYIKIFTKRRKVDVKAK